jgi:queuine tRNA-ribosyltransferase
VQKKYFRYKYGKLKLPVFFPDATRGVIKSIDTSDIEGTKTRGLLVNTYHLYKEMGKEKIRSFGGIRKLMDYNGAVISDSGGFQVGSLIKKNPELGHVTDEGVTFKLDGQRILLTPEESIRFQMLLGTDMVVALDDFDAPGASYKENKLTVKRTVEWAVRSKSEFEKICDEKKLSKINRPYLLGVVQGGRSKRLRKYCIDALLQIGFDGLGYGGEEKVRGNINYDLAEFISANTPDNYLLYALGVGKPDNIVEMSKRGYQIFDCVLPTRDARHRRLYVYNFDSIRKINVFAENFYSFYTPDKMIYREDLSPISTACDCLLCRRYSKAYLAHLFKIGDSLAGRLSTIHNLRFYSLLMELIRKGKK